MHLRDIDLAAGTLTAHGPDGVTTLKYDGLVIATGSVARPSPFDPHPRGVFSLRNLVDGLLMRDALAGARRLVLVGGGFIGLEVAAVARQADLALAVVERPTCCSAMRSEPPSVSAWRVCTATVASTSSAV